MVEEQWQTSGLAKLLDDTRTRQSTVASTTTDGTSTEKPVIMMDSLIQLASVNQKDVSMYLKTTKEDQKKYHDWHASSEMKDLQPRTKVRMQPWTDSRKWKPVTVVRQKKHTTALRSSGKR